MVNMKSDERYPWVMVLCLPLILVMALNVQPVPVQISQAWQTINDTQGNSASRVKTAAALQLVAEWQPWRVDLWERIARQYFLAKDWDSAIQYYQAAERVGSLSQESVLKLADAYESVGRLDNANAIWQGMIENNHPPVGVYQKALAYTWSQGDWAAAQQILLAWLGVDEKNAEANYRLGLLRFVSEPGSAEKLLLKATSQDESYLPKVSNLVKVLHEKPSETQKEYNLVKAGRALGGVGEWQMAKAAFEQAIRENAEYAEAWAYLGEAKQQLNEGGMRELKQAVALDPVSIASQALLALYYRRLGNPDLALMYLHEIALLEPDQAVWHVELGNTLAEMTWPGPVKSIKKLWNWNQTRPNGGINRLYSHSPIRLMWLAWLCQQPEKHSNYSHRMCAIRIYWVGSYLPWETGALPNGFLMRPFGMSPIMPWHIYTLVNYI
jgi:tetratricopeptide (TPR) repeat protein